MSEGTSRNIYGLRKMSVTTTRLEGMSFREALAGVFNRWPVKVIAGAAKVSPRTVEGWRAAKSAPEAEALVALLHDEQLAPQILASIGLVDLATAKEALGKLRAAKVALDEIGQ